MLSLIFRQMFEHRSSTYTYLLACATTREAVIIDPVIETVKRDAQLIKQLHLNLRFAANTHCHADHVTGSGELKKLFPQMKTVIGELSTARADILVNHGEKLTFGNQFLEVRSTPGHTNGNPQLLYEKVHSEILSLPKDYLLYPGHDYKGFACTSVEEELENNPRLTKTKEEFVDIMNNLNLALPKQIEKSVPANIVCGVFDLMDEKTKNAVEETYTP